jgi:hypothetical protein
MERQGNAANPARFLRPLHFAVEKHVAYRTEKRRAVRPPERNACRQRLQRLEVGASLAFILARVAAWARNVIRRRGSNPVRWPAMRQPQYGQLLESTLGQSPRARMRSVGSTTCPARTSCASTGAFLNWREREARLNWREREARASVANVCLLRQSGKDLLSTSLSHFDPKETSACSVTLARAPLSHSRGHRA